MVKCLVLALNSNEACDLGQMTSPPPTSVSQGVKRVNSLFCAARRDAGSAWNKIHSEHLRS